MLRVQDVTACSHLPLWGVTVLSRIYGETHEGGQEHLIVPDVTCTQAHVQPSRRCKEPGVWIEFCSRLHAISCWICGWAFQSEGNAAVWTALPSLSGLVLALFGPLKAVARNDGATTNCPPHYFRPQPPIMSTICATYCQYCYYYGYCYYYYKYH